MGKRVYISADYDLRDGDQEVVEQLNAWANDNKHLVDFVDMAKVISGTVANEPDCRICDLKEEFNKQINASSAVIFVVGNRTKDRTAGCACNRSRQKQSDCTCTPYKNNPSGNKPCKVVSTSTPGENDDYGSINSVSYLQHEFMQAKKKGKAIIIVYNSKYKQASWLPSYMKDYEYSAKPIWTTDSNGREVGDYAMIKKALGY